MPKINNNLAKSWDSIKNRISAVSLPYNDICQSLKNAGCPVKPTDIGWDETQYNNAVKFAKYTRSRFTFLDMG